MCMYTTHTHACWKSGTSKETGIQISGALPKNVLKKATKSKEAYYLDQEAGKNQWEAGEGKLRALSTPGSQVNLSTRGHHCSQLGEKRQRHTTQPQGYRRQAGTSPGSATRWQRLLRQEAHLWGSLNHMHVHNTEEHVHIQTRALQVL